MGKERPSSADKPLASAPAIPARALPGADFRTRECSLFAALYRGLQDQTGELVPPRKAFSPSAARAFLPYVSIFEIHEPRLALVRLVGTAIVSRTHIDNTGRNMLDLFPREARDWSWGHFRRVLDTPCGCTFLSQEDYEHASVLIEIVSFPFSDLGSKPQFIVSLSIEIDRQELMLRGDQAMQIGELHGYRYLDIGAGT